MSSGDCSIKVLLEIMAQGLDGDKVLLKIVALADDKVLLEMKSCLSFLHVLLEIVAQGLTGDCGIRV